MVELMNLMFQKRSELEPARWIIPASAEDIHAACGGV